MQFIAEDPIHVVVRNEVPALVNQLGQTVAHKQRRLFAKFSRGTAPGWAREVGLAAFDFRKMPEGGVERGQWLAFYDSVEAQQGLGWTDDERAAIEAKLEITDGAIRVEKPRLTAPWPKYDQLVAKRGEAGAGPKQIVDKILEKIDDDGYSAEDILAYELENQARPELVDALRERLASPAATEEDDDEELIEA